MKVLNLYSGIGGNRKLWGDADVTAVEHDESIAAIYRDLNPCDEIIVGDAHEFLRKNFLRFDFIWSSPPCQTHSKLNFSGRSRGKEFLYPDMALYQQIILLRSFHKGLFCIENVKGYYQPLIKPQESGRHFFWANFKISDISVSSKVRNDKGQTLIKKMSDRGFNISEWHGYSKDRRQLVNNCVEPTLGLHVFNCATQAYLLNKEQKVQASVATDDDSSTKADKQK